MTTRSFLALCALRVAVIVAIAAVPLVIRALPRARGVLVLDPVFLAACAVLGAAYLAVRALVIAEQRVRAELERGGNDDHRLAACAIREDGRGPGGR